MNEFVAFIPVRGGSKSIPLKNICEINGRPLVYWTLDAAVRCAAIDKVYVCTDSSKIRNKVDLYIDENGCADKLICIDRPEETATDTASTESAMLYFARLPIDFKHIVLIQATSPLLTSQHLSNAIGDYHAGEYDSMLSVVRQKRFCWRKAESGYEPINYNYSSRPRRQEFDGYLVENGAFYINTREGLLRDECRLSGKIGAYEMEEESYFEIDELSDWIIIERLMQRKINDVLHIGERISQVKMLLVDCDGVMTDGGMYYSDKGDESKKFNTKDGMAVEMLREQGIKFGIITGENIELVSKRAAKIKADECHIGVKDKAAILALICDKYGYTPSNIAYIGDDRNDLEVLRKVGFPCSVADGSKEAIGEAVYVTKACGGKGVIREVAELMLSYRNKAIH